jgi:hypothetical protein
MRVRMRMRPRMLGRRHGPRVVLVLFVCVAINLHDASISLPRGGGAAAARWEGWHVAPHREAGCEFVVLRRGVGAESGAFGVGL